MTIEFATLGGIDNIVRSWNNFNAFVPQSIGNKGVTTQSPTQELVDTYRKLDGSVADDTDYEKRDKRFEATIAYNNWHQWIFRKQNPESGWLGRHG